MSAEAQTAFEAANSIKELSPEDVIFKHDAAKHRAILDTRPWSKECVHLLVWHSLTF
jgi:hypothetical protein